MRNGILIVGRSRDVALVHMWFIGQAICSDFFWHSDHPIFDIPKVQKLTLKMVSFTTVLAFAGIVSAHFHLNYPFWRGDSLTLAATNDSITQWNYPCKCLMLQAERPCRAENPTDQSIPDQALALAKLTRPTTVPHGLLMAVAFNSPARTLGLIHT